MDCDNPQYIGLYNPRTNRQPRRLNTAMLTATLVNSGTHGLY